MPHDPADPSADAPITEEELEIIRAMRAAAQKRKAELDQEQESKQRKAEIIREEARLREEERLKKEKEQGAGEDTPRPAATDLVTGETVDHAEPDPAEVAAQIAANPMRRRSSKRALTEEELETLRMEAEVRREKERAKKRILKRLKNRVRRVLPFAVIAFCLVAAVLLYLVLGKARTGKSVAQKSQITETGAKAQSQKKITEIRTSSAGGGGQSLNAELATKSGPKAVEKLELSPAMKARLEAVSEEPEVVVIPPDYRKLVKELMTSINEADDVEKLAPLIRRPEEVIPKITKHLERGGKMPAFLPDQQMRYSSDQTHNGMRLFEMTGVDTDYRPGVYYVEVTKEDGLLLDWESMVGFNDLTFEQYVRVQPFGVHQFRVVGSRQGAEGTDDFPEEEYQALRLFDPQDEAQFLIGFIRKDDPDMEELLKVMQADGGRYWRATVAVSFPLNSKSGERNVKVEELIEPGWLIP